MSLLLEKCLKNLERIFTLALEPYEYFNIDAVFSDETENFRKTVFGVGKNLTTVKIRTGLKNADKVYINIGSEKIEMKKISEDEFFEFYEAEIEHFENKITYFFEIDYLKKKYFYNKEGVVVKINNEYNFAILPKFKTPDWVKGAVMYQIYVDRFYNGDKSNDVVNNEYEYLGKAAKKIENWNKSVANEDICNFYGGDLQGVIDKMDYLKELGVEVIYFNPIFVSPSNHKYDIQDYDYVDPHYGVILEDGGEPLYFENFENKYATMYIKRTTEKVNLEASNRLMIKLIELAHKKGIKVILDGVFNHCGAFNKWLDKEGFYKANNYPTGAYEDKESIYHNYFKWHEDKWPNNNSYDAWWGHDNHPKLNFEDSKELYSYIIGIGKKWVSPPYNADGWRLDVAADLGTSEEFNHKFWRDFRKAVKTANPDAVIFAEHYGDASSWLQGDQWDSIMNYDAFMEPLTWFLTGMEKHSERYDEGMYCNAEQFEKAMKYNMAKLSFEALTIAMNELSNHDHSRFLTRTNKTVGRLHTMGAEKADININKGIMREAITVQMTWIGAPTVYYGDEAGLTGWTDPDNRRTYPWGREDKELINFHKEMIGLHKSFECIKKGSTEYLLKDYGILSYGRWLNDECVIVALNNNAEERSLEIPVWRANVKDGASLEKIMLTDEKGYCTEKEFFEVNNGMIKVSVPPFGSVVLAKR